MPTRSKSLPFHPLLSIALGVLAFPSLQAAEFTGTMFRFKPTKLRSTAPEIQLSEFKLLSSGNPVMGGCTVTAPGGSSPFDEDVVNLLDNDVSTKWFANFSASVGVSLVFTFPTARTVDGYTFATANDAASRDPVSWELAYTNVSSPTEADWIKVDRKTLYPTTQDRFTYIPDLTIPSQLPPEILSFDAGIPAGETSPTTSVVRNGKSVELSWSGTDADSFSLTPGPGNVNGNLSAVVNPPDNADTTYTLSATNPEATLTSTRTLRSVAGGTATFKYVRFRPLATRSSAGAFFSKVQLADFIFYNHLNDADPLNDVEIKPSQVRLSNGSFTETAVNGPNKLKDGDPGTKWSYANYIFNVHSVIFDMTDSNGNAIPFDTYKITTANDSPGSDPIRWIIEGANSDTSSPWTRIDDLSTFDVSIPASRSTVVEMPMPGGSLPPTSAFTADAIKVVAGEPLNLYWTSQDAASVTITPAPGSVALVGYTTVYPTESATYTMTATSPAGYQTIKTVPVTVIPAAPATINYPDFDAANDELSLLGSAAVVNDFANIPLPGDVKRLRLTPDVTDKTGAAWFAKRIATYDGFDTTFSFQLSKPDAMTTGADGFLFMVQNSPAGNGAVVNKDGLLSRALNIRFDSYYNPEDGDEETAAAVQVCTEGNYLTVVDLGNVPGITLNYGSETGLPALTDSYTAAPHTVRVKYAPGSLDVWFDGVQIVTNLAVDLGDIGATNAEGKSWVGFAANTGGFSENHDITSWTFTTPSSAPAPFVITGYTFNLATGEGVLTWRSTPAMTYRITGSSTLNDGFPQVLATGIASGGSATTANFHFTPGTVRFFRVEEEP